MLSINPIVILIILPIWAGSEDYSFIDLPSRHLSIYFNNFPNIKNQCLKDNECNYKTFLLSDKYDDKLCWGYNNSCRNKFWQPICPGPHGAWIKDKETQIQTFFSQADFGYVKQQINEMSLICEPKFYTDSSLECSGYLRFCRGRNLMINFTSLLDRTDPIRYQIDVLKQGEVGGRCTLHKEKLLKEIDHLGALQSWAPELRFFEQFNYNPIEDKKCDILIKKPTFIMKIDATSNMYHHFCDFFNLYASLHVNSTGPMLFNRDIHILIWESYIYESPFAETFRAFTKNPILDLNNVRGKTVCFKNVVFPLLPRMIFGLYYNTPIIQGCEKSGLFRAFSEFILHRLNIPLLGRQNKNIRITFLVRRTKYRRVLNEDELFNEIARNPNYEVQKVSFGRGISFTNQLKIIRNTDILIGIHGAGLTHLLFLPNWATIFELYNCEDPNCYKDLARLRGINYLTWEDELKLTPSNDGNELKGGAQAKFTNYIFDIPEFKRLVKIAENNVLNHREFLEFTEAISLPSKDEL